MSYLQNIDKKKVDLKGKYIVTPSDAPIQSDYIARIQNGSITYSMTSNQFLDYQTQARNTENLLIKVAKNLWETHRYNQEYISFLIGGYTEEEFLKLAEEFAEKPLRDLTEEQISFAFNILSSLLDRELSSSDLSVLLNQDCSFVELALKNSKHPIAP